MSVRVMNAVFQHSQSKLADRLVLLAIADFADDEGHAWPAVETFAVKACVSVRTAQRCLRNLEAMGELQVIIQAGPYTVNRYRVLVTGGDKLSPRQADGGCQPCHQGGDSRVTRGVTAVSPNPSSEPSAESSSPPMGPPTAKRKTSEKTGWPDGFVLTQSRRDYAVQRGVVDPDGEWEHFAVDAAKQGKRWCDWDAAWRNWVLQGVKRFGAASRPLTVRPATCAWSVRDGYRLKPCDQPVAPTAGKSRLCAVHMAERRRLDERHSPAIGTGTMGPSPPV